MIGTLFGLGVGPGDPELLTIKAYRILKEAAVITYPKSRKGSKSYAQQIIDAFVNPDEKEMIGLLFPMTKDKDILDSEWSKAVDLIWTKLSEGKDVAFVTEGDPLLYSTFIHLMKLMKKMYPQAPITTIPGISSINGAASALGIPLADGDEKVAIVPATANVDDMKKVLLENDCVIFLKIAKVLEPTLKLLTELDLLNKAAVVTKVTSDEEVIWDIKDLTNVELEYLSLMVVRK